MLTREQLHHLIDAIPDDRLGPVREAAEKAVPPAVLAALRAPIDDEPETEEERAAVAEAQEAYQRGEIVGHDEIE